MVGLQRNKRYTWLRSSDHLLCKNAPGDTCWDNLSIITSVNYQPHNSLTNATTFYLRIAICCDLIC